MAWKRRSSGDGAGVHAPGVSVMSDVDIGHLLTGIRAGWEGESSVRSASLAMLRGEEVAFKALGEKALMLQETGKKVASILRMAVREGSIPGWDPQNFGQIVSGQRMGAIANVIAGTEQMIEGMTGGLVTPGDPTGGLEDEALAGVSSFLSSLGL